MLEISCRSSTNDCLGSLLICKSRKLSQRGQGILFFLVINIFHGGPYGTPTRINLTPSRGDPYQNLQRKSIATYESPRGESGRPVPTSGSSHVSLILSFIIIIIEPRHELANNVICATSKASDKPAHMRSLVRAFASRLGHSITVKLRTEHHLEFLSLKGGCTVSSESKLVEMPHCWKSHVAAHIIIYNILLLHSLLINLLVERNQHQWTQYIELHIIS